MAKDSPATPTVAPRPTLADVLANTLNYGFMFQLGALNKKIEGELTALRAQPILTVVDTAKFEAAFPGVQLKHSNGSSIRVHSQAIGRDAAWKNSSVKPEDVKLWNVQQICFGSTASTVNVATVTVKMTDAEAAAMVALLVDAGVDAGTALEKVNAIRNG